MPPESVPAYRAPEHPSAEYWAELRAAGLPSPWRGAAPNIVSFVLTLLSVYFVGVANYGGAWGGIRLCLGLISILMAHEMGHYVACRRYGVNSTLPFFIPAPWGPIGPGYAWLPLSFIGTFGAVIRIKSPFPDRKALFDVGIAGPLCGFIVALPVLVLGIFEARLIPAADAPEDSVGLGTPLLFNVAVHALRGDVPAGMVLNFGPLALAAWFGLLITALNLMPVGQLDGGHVAYAVLRRRALIVSRVVSALALVLVWLRPLWLVWAVLLFLLGRRHPPTLDDATPLGAPRVGLACVAVVVFALCFTPSPIHVTWAEFLRALSDATGF
jgi:membrane-associated protease RseP (regulator of RpoE activity)